MHENECCVHLEYGKKQSLIFPHFLKHEELLKHDSKAEGQIFFQLKQENMHDLTQPGKPPLMYPEIVDQSRLPVILRTNSKDSLTYKNLTLLELKNLTLKEYSPETVIGLPLSSL